MKAYRIPDHQTMPSEEMIDFLDENTMDWSGDESGIALDVRRIDGEVEDELGAPGDWVVCINGVYRIRPNDWMMEKVILGMDFTKYDGPDPEFIGGH